MSDLRITAIRVRSNHRKYRFRLIMMMIFHPCSMHGLMLAQTCMQRCYFTNKNHPTQSCEYLMQRKTKTMWGSPFYQGKWGPGVPIFMGSPKFYDTGFHMQLPSMKAVQRVTSLRRVAMKNSRCKSFTSTAGENGGK